MRMIDVLIKLSKGEIKNGTILTVNDKQYKYIENCFLDDYNFPLDIYGEKDLNSEVILIVPEHKKYYLRVNEHDTDVINYINRRNEDFGVNSYTINDKKEVNGYRTKFTQSEIDDDQFLKFVEKYELIEVEDNEND